MTISNSTKNSLLLALSVCFLLPHTTYTQETMADQIPAAVMKEQQDALDQLLRQHLAHAKALDRLLEDQLILMSSGAIKVTDKQTIINNIKDLKEFIGSLNNEGFVQIDIPTLQLLAFLNKSIMEHMIKALDNYLVAFPAVSYRTNHDASQAQL